MKDMDMKGTVKKMMKYAARAFGHRPVRACVVKMAPGELLAGRTALVTGGTSGIGYAIADAFLSAGAEVVVTSRDERRAEEARRSLSARADGGKVRGVALDVSDAAHLRAAFGRAVAATSGGCFDILVNNAGILGNGSVFRDTPEGFGKVLDTNLRGAAFMGRVAAEHMIGNKLRGNILNVASSSSLRPAVSAYMLSKWGMRGLTLGLAKTLIPYGIVVNGIAPGPTATPMLLPEGCRDIGRDTLPNGRYAMPEEIANMAVVLVSGMGRTVVGDIVCMTGGAGLVTFDDIDYGI